MTALARLAKLRLLRVRFASTLRPCASRFAYRPASIMWRSPENGIVQGGLLIVDCIPSQQASGNPFRCSHRLTNGRMLTLE